MHEHHMVEQTDVRLSTKNNSPIISATSEGKSNSILQVAFDDMPGEKKNKINRNSKTIPSSKK